MYIICIALFPKNFKKFHAYFYRFIFLNFPKKTHVYFYTFISLNFLWRKQEEEEKNSPVCPYIPNVSRDIKKELICQLIRVRVGARSPFVCTTHFFSLPAWCRTWGTCWFQSVVGVVYKTNIETRDVGSKELYPKP